jgi:hypothetical protein
MKEPCFPNNFLLFFLEEIEIKHYLCQKANRLIAHKCKHDTYHTKH